MGGLLCVYVGKYHSWNIAFALAGIVMIIGLVIFLFTQRSLGPIGLSPLKDMAAKKRKLLEYSVFIGSLLAIPIIKILVTNTAYTDLFMYIIGPATLIYVLVEMKKYSLAEQKKLIAALVFILFSILFWAFFEPGSHLSLLSLG